MDGQPQPDVCRSHSFRGVYGKAEEAGIPGRGSGLFSRYGLSVCSGSVRLSVYDPGAWDDMKHLVVRCAEFRSAPAPGFCERGHIVRIGCVVGHHRHGEREGPHGDGGHEEDRLEDPFLFSLFRMRHIRPSDSVPDSMLTLEHLQPPLMDLRPWVPI